MADVLIIADTRSSPEMRHEVPLMIPDPFLYAEAAGKRHVAVGSLEKSRIEDLGVGIEVVALDELGYDELVREVYLRACRSIGIEEALVPEGFPLGAADYLRANGISLTVDADHFRLRRRVKNEAEIAGIRRAQSAAEAAMASVPGA